MPRCAKCDREYSSDYDACPHCAGKGGTADRLQSCGCIFVILVALPFVVMAIYILADKFGLR